MIGRKLWTVKSLWCGVSIRWSSKEIASDYIWSFVSRLLWNLGCSVELGLLVMNGRRDCNNWHIILVVVLLDGLVQNLLTTNLYSSKSRQCEVSNYICLQMRFKILKKSRERIALRLNLEATAPSKWDLNGVHWSLAMYLWKMCED